jgi:hypothetical protein
MVSNDLQAHGHVRRAIGLGISIICLSVPVRVYSMYAYPMCALERAVSYSAYASLELVRGTLKLAAKVVRQNPKILVLIIVLCYYEEIWQALQDGAGYAVGEFPLTSLAAGLLVLWYFSELYK